VDVFGTRQSENRDIVACGLPDTGEGNLQSRACLNEKHSMPLSKRGSREAVSGLRGHVFVAEEYKPYSLFCKKVKQRVAGEAGSEFHPFHLEYLGDGLSYFHFSPPLRNRVKLRSTFPLDTLRTDASDYVTYFSFRNKARQGGSGI
jgi:hypothetical protein